VRVDCAAGWSGVGWGGRVDTTAASVK